MKRFYRKVDTNDRRAMIAFLATHERYDTMHSWNGATSYANCVKIHRMDLTREQMNKAWGMLDMPEAFAAMRMIMDEWAASHGWQWQARFAGKSGGYLVLYTGGMDGKNAMTAECDVCGNTTWHKQDVPCTTEGCPGTLRVLDKPRPRLVTYIGQPVDQSAEFDDWETESLQERVRLVRDFDMLCDRVVDEFLRYCARFNVIEKTIKVRQRVKALEPVPA